MTRGRDNLVVTAMEISTDDPRYIGYVFGDQRTRTTDRHQRAAARDCHRGRRGDVMVFELEVEMFEFVRMLMKMIVLMGDSADDANDVEATMLPGMLALGAATQNQRLRESHNKTMEAKGVEEGRGLSVHGKPADTSGGLRRGPMKETASKATRWTGTAGACTAASGSARRCRSRVSRVTPTRTTPPSRIARGRSSCRHCVGKLTDGYAKKAIDGGTITMTNMTIEVFATSVKWDLIKYVDVVRVANPDGKVEPRWCHASGELKRATTVRSTRCPEEKDYCIDCARSINVCQ